MTLATRCPACGTSFRVVQDQLKVSEGWVRCGRCNEVFNAIESLFDTDTAPAFQPPSSQSQSAATIFAPQPPQLPAWPSPTAEQTAQSLTITPPVHDNLPLGFDAATAERAVESMATEDPAAQGDTPRATAPEHEDFPVETGAPGFVLQANRAASWNRPHVRAAMIAAAAVFGMLLAGQTAWLFRDRLAARWPASRAALESACVWAGCTVEPLRHITALAVDSSGLNQYEGTTIYRLSVVLHNRSDIEVMLPALDLVLTDTQGAVVARRVLRTSELGSNSRVLAAGAELALQASLNTGERRVSGYTIEIFYP